MIAANAALGIFGQVWRGLRVVTEPRRTREEQAALGGVEEVRDVAVALLRIRVGGAARTPEAARTRRTIADRVQALVDLTDHRAPRRPNRDHAQHAGEGDEQHDDRNGQSGLERHDLVAGGSGSRIV